MALRDEQAAGAKLHDHAGLIAIACLVMAHKFPVDLSLTYLPAILRKNGIALEQLSGLSIILIPFWFRWAWSPIVDHNGSQRFGHRKSWILPCSILAATIYLLVSFIEPTPENLAVLIFGLAIASLVMATQQVASDAYMVENIRPQDRTIGSAYIELGRSVSAIAIAIGLLTIYDLYGWFYTMAAAAGTFLFFTSPVLFRREAPRPDELTQRFEEGNVASFGSILRDPSHFFGSFMHPFKDFIGRKESRVLIPLIIFMAANLKLVQTTMPVFLVDMGFSLTEVGIMIGIGAAGGSIIGALISTRILRAHGFRKSASICLVLMVIAFIPWTLLTFFQVKSFVISILCLGCLGMLATPTQVLVMAARFRWASRAQAGTDFTFQTSAEFVGYSLGAAIAGPLAAQIGWGPFFVFALLLSVIGITTLRASYDFVESNIEARSAV